MTWGKAVLIAIDQLLNALVGGWPDETLSSRCYRWDVAGVTHWPRRTLDAVARLLGDPDHCRASFESERQGRQLPPEMRRG